MTDRSPLTSRNSSMERPIDNSSIVRVLFVCIGNICRSPTAEGIFQSMVEKAGLADKIKTDSAGMSSYHIGERADQRAQDAAKLRGYDLQSRARKFTIQDFRDFDYILPMDESNIFPMMQMASDETERNKVIPFISLVKNEEGYPDVPDPYYGGKPDYERVLNICEEGCQSLLGKIRKEKKI
jgi:protein-tyrosine phosphatase